MRWAELRMCRFWAGGISSFPFSRAREYRLLRRLGIYWDGKYYHDKVLPFGVRSAPYLINQLSDAIEWILKNKCMISFVCHILDEIL